MVPCAVFHVQYSSAVFHVQSLGRANRGGGNPRKWSVGLLVSCGFCPAFFVRETERVGRSCPRLAFVADDRRCSERALF